MLCALALVCAPVAFQAPSGGGGPYGRSGGGLNGSQVRAMRVLERLRDPGLPIEQRRALLEQLAADRASLPLEPVMAVRALGSGQWLPDWIRILGRCGPAAVPELRKYLKRRDPEVQAETIYALALDDVAGGEDFARSVLRDSRRPEIAWVAALRALTELGSPYARIEALRRLRSEEDGPLMMEALRTLRSHPDLGDAPYLVDLVGAEQGRATNEAVRMLQELTGYRIGRDPRSWRYFLLKHRAEGTPFRIQESSGHSGNSTTPTLSYLGIPVLGQKVVFVLDSSGSMMERLPEQRALTRGQKAVEELIALLPRLPQEARFDVVFFSGRVSSFAGKLTSRDPATLQRVTEWLRSNPFDGGTNLYGGLEEAFSRDGVDEIFLLSDGEPTVGELVEPGWILARLARWNRWRDVRVNTISLGAPPRARAFLARAAARNDGVCRVID